MGQGDRRSDRPVTVRNPAGSTSVLVASAWAGLKLLARRNSNSGLSGRRESISQYTRWSSGLCSPFFDTTYQPRTRTFSIASAFGIGSMAFPVWMLASLRTGFSGRG